MDGILYTVQNLKLWDLALWDVSFLGNTVGDYGQALAVFVGLLILFKVFQVIIVARLKALASKTETDIDDTLVRIVKSLRPPFYSFIAFYFAIQALALHSILGQVVTVVLIAWVTAQVTVAVQILLDYVFRKRFDEEEDEHALAAVDLIKSIVKGVLWVIAVLMALSNLGVNITSLIAGLGIGGVAIALALQNILSDLFSSFSIYFDKPFEVGDFIIVGDKLGTVEKIGIKTTRLRALQGEEIVISNQELTSAQIQNFKKMAERRIVFSFGVTYDTPNEKLEKIPTIVQNIIGQREKARFDRAHFKNFGDSSLGYEAVYYVQTGDYYDYMDTQQFINLKIKAEFEKEGIEMAFPTRTVHLVK